MKKEVLIIATISSFVECFEMNDIRILQDKGFVVHLAANFENDRGRDYFRYFQGYGVVTHQIDFHRSPFNVQNVKCIKQIQNVLQKGSFRLVHCHTPVGGVIGRIAARQFREKGCKVIYTVHGLQFCKGETWINWAMFYPIEKLLSGLADAVITINKEDFSLVKRRFLNQKTYYIPGVGISCDAFQFDQKVRESKRREFGLKDSDVLIFSSGELSKRKNHQVILRALAKIPQKNVVYMIAGDGMLGSELKTLAEQLGLSERFRLLGFRNDIRELLIAADIFAFPSKHEGLGISLLEAMAMGLPCVSTRVQGIKDLLGERQVLHKWNDAVGYADTISRMISDTGFRCEESQWNCQKAREFDISVVDSIMRGIYTEVMEG